MRGLSLVAASGGHFSSRCAGLSLSRPLLLRSTGSRRAGSVVVAHGPSGSAACGIFPDQGSNPCPLHWQADSQPLRHQGSPCHFFAGRQGDIYNLENIPLSGDRWSTVYTQSGGNPALQKRRNADGSLKKCLIPLRIHVDRFHLPALHSQKTLSLILLTSSAFTCSKVLLLVEY